MERPLKKGRGKEGNDQFEITDRESVESVKVQRNTVCATEQEITRETGNTITNKLYLDVGVRFSSTGFGTCSALGRHDASETLQAQRNTSRIQIAHRFTGPYYNYWTRIDPQSNVMSLLCGEACMSNVRTCSSAAAAVPRASGWSDGGSRAGRPQGHTAARSAPPAMRNKYRMKDNER